MQELTTAKYLTDTDDASQEPLAPAEEYGIAMEQRRSPTRGVNSLGLIMRFIPMLLLVSAIGGFFWWQNSARLSNNHSEKHPVDQVVENPLFRVLYWMNGSDYREVQNKFAEKRAERKRAFDNTMR